MFHVEDLLSSELAPLNKIVLEAGKGGIGREISWPNTILTIPISKWLLPGEMVIISGIGMKITEAEMLQIVSDADQGMASCIAFMLNEDIISGIPKSVKDYADSINIPVLSLPWDVPLGMLMSKVSERIMQENLKERLKNQFILELFSPNPDEEICYQHAEMIGINLNAKNRVLLYKLINIREILEKRKLKDEEMIYHFKNQIGTHAENFWKQMGVKCVWAIQKSSLIMVCTFDEDIDDSVERLSHKFIVHMKENCPELVARLGISESRNRIADYLMSMREARTAVDANRSSKPVLFFHNLGILQILMLNTNGNQLKGLYDETLSRLREQDSSGELMHTLEVYLENCGNVLQSSKDLYIHRNTLQNRIARLESILKVDLNDAYARNNLLNAIIVGRYLK